MTSCYLHLPLLYLPHLLPSPLCLNACLAEIVLEKNIYKSSVPRWAFVSHSGRRCAHRLAQHASHTRALRCGSDTCLTSIHPGLLGNSTEADSHSAHHWGSQLMNMISSKWMDIWRYFWSLNVFTFWLWFEWRGVLFEMATRHSCDITGEIKLTALGAWGVQHQVGKPAVDRTTLQDLQRHGNKLDNRPIVCHHWSMTSAFLETTYNHENMP